MPTANGVEGVGGKSGPAVTEKPKVEGWRAWQAEDAHEPPLWTRGEVLAAAERLGVTPPVDERTLRYWEGKGIVPRGDRRGPAGHEQVLYPWWTVDLLAIVRRYQRARYKLAQLPPLMRLEARRLSRDSLPRRRVGEEVGAVRRFSAYSAPGAAEPLREPLGPPSQDPAQHLQDPTDELRRSLRDTVASLATIHRLADRVTIEAAELHLRASTGQVFRYAIAEDGALARAEGEEHIVEEFIATLPEELRAEARAAWVEARQP